MVHLETVEELAESLADIGGIYGCGEGGDNGFADHPETCNCRICFVSAITERIRQAVKNDIFLSNMKEMSKSTNDIENKGDMPCRHPFGTCRFMIGRKKPYTKSPDKRLCGIASPDSECIRISRTRMESADKTISISKLALAMHGV